MFETYLFCDLWARVSAGLCVLVKAPEGHKSRSNKTASVSSDLGTVVSFIGRLCLYLAEALVLG